MSEKSAQGSFYEVTGAQTTQREGYEINEKGKAFTGRGLRAGVKNRHINLIALAGIIGPGTIIGIASGLSSGGGVGLLLGFIIVATMVMAIMCFIGEMNSMLDANFAILGSRFVSKGLGGTVAIFYVIIWITCLVGEYTNLCGSMLTFSENLPLWGWVIVFWAFFNVLAMLPVDYYGELEYILAWVKIVYLAGYYIFAIVYAAGGIKYNKPDNPMGKYPFNGGFKGVANSFVYAGTFYAGVEAVSMIVAEARNPRKAMPSAVRNTVGRIFFVYFGIAISYGITVPYTEPLLSSESRVTRSPQTIALTQAGWANSKYFVATMVLVTCLSSINCANYLGSRALFTWARDGFGPKIFCKLNKQGVPWVSVLFINAFAFLALLSWKTGTATAYSYIVNVSGVATFIVWTLLAVIHYRFRKGALKQGLSLDHLPFKAPFFPWLDYFAMILGLVLILVQGWSCFVPFSVGTFVDAYILLPLFFICWAGYDLYFKTKLIKYEDMDFITGRRPDLDDDVSLDDGVDVTKVSVEGDSSKKA